MRWYKWSGSLASLRSAGHVFPGVLVELDTGDVRLIGHGRVDLPDNATVTRFTYVVDLTQVRAQRDQAGQRTTAHAS